MRKDKFAYVLHKRQSCCIVFVIFVAENVGFVTFDYNGQKEIHAVSCVHDIRIVDHESCSLAGVVEYLD
jgi:hypothetical protein